MSQFSGKRRTKGSFHFFSLPLLTPQILLQMGSLMNSIYTVKEKGPDGQKKREKEEKKLLGTAGRGRQCRTSFFLDTNTRGEF